jgi:predicted permease
MNTFVRDIRYALRQLRNAPGFTLTAVLTLALGIGALTTVATWTNAVLFDPWPQVASPGSIRFIDATVLGGEGYSVHYDQYRFVREQAHSFTDAAAFSLSFLNLNLPGRQPLAITADTVSSNYFQLLGLQPQLGRYFDSTANDRAFGAHDEIVLSDALWRDRFAADRNVIGRAVQINHNEFTIIGVAPAGFTGIYGGMAESAWIPLSSLRSLSPDANPDPLVRYGLQIVVRLRHDTRDAAAAAELHALARTFASMQHDSGNYNGWNLNLRDSSHFERGLFGIIGMELPVLLAASGLLMLLVCINIASLLGQQAARRRREVAIRTALGAAPARIAAQVLVETGLLAAAGAVAGWAASTGMSRALYVLLPSFGLPMSFNLHSDKRILFFIAAVAIAVTLICGMYPVRQSLRVSQRDALHEGSARIAGNPRRRSGQRLLLGLQLGACFIVLVGCGLLTRSAFNVLNRDVGFERANRLTAFVDLSRSGYNEQGGLAFQAELLDRLRSEPGVESATLTSHLPMGDMGSGNTQDFNIPGHVPAKGEEMAVVTDFEGADFFRTAGIALAQGREFGVHDHATSPNVAMINQDMAQRYWPNGDAIGHSVVVFGKPWQIVGIVRDFVYHNPQETGSSPLLFLPMAQHYVSDVFIAVHTRATAPSSITQLRQIVSSLDRSLPLEYVQSLDEVSATQYQLSRIPAELLGVYALSSVLVAMIGLYAVMAYSVIERHREFALRMALGSTREEIFRLVLNGAASVFVVGLVTGCLGSIAAVRLLRSTLFGVAPSDPVSFCAAAIVLLLTVFVSGLVPARRAATIDPMKVLRSE